MLAQGLVLLSQNDADAPLLPAVATVSTDDAWDDGGYALGVAAAAQGRLWVDRPYFTGNPSVEWMVQKVDRVTAAGGWAQLGNEQNLPLEGWAGGITAWWEFEADVRAGVAHPERVLAMPPSPGVPSWEDWVGLSGPFAVHAYGTCDQMRAVVGAYLEETEGDLYVTECNPGAGQEFDLDAWAEGELRPFLDWCAGEPRVKAVCYFAWRWNESATLPASINAAGSLVEDVLVGWVPPANGGSVDDIVLSVETETAIASPANYDPNRARTIGVVIHTTRGGGAPENEYDATVAWFQNPSAGVSAHLVVGSPAPDRVARCVHDDDTAWHARTANADHLGIEVCQSRDGDPISDFAYGAAAEACRLWAERYEFPLERVYSEETPGLVGHEDTESGKQDGKTDPGGAFDWDRFLALCTGAAPPATDWLTDLQQRTWDALDLVQALAGEWEAYGWPSTATGISSAAEAAKSHVRSSKGER